MSLTPLPTAAEVVSLPSTEAAQQLFSDLVNAVGESLGMQPEGDTLTITNGLIQINRAAHVLDTEAGAAADDLTNIDLTDIPDGRVVVLRVTDPARVVTIKHGAGGTGQIMLARAEDLLLDAADKRIMLILNGDNWYELTRSNFGALSAKDMITPDDLDLNFVDDLDPDTIEADDAILFVKADESEIKRGSVADIVALTSHSQMLANCKLVVTVASNALTVAVKTQAGDDPSMADPVIIAFRSATESDGGYAIRKITAGLSLTVSAGSSLGFGNTETNYLHVGFIDNAGSVELAISKDGGLWTEDRTVGTTAEGGAGAADSGTTLYSMTARTGVACRLAALVYIQTGASGGDWSNGPTRITLVTTNPYQPFVNTLKASVNFDGTGTISIRSAFNVASITDIGTGTYTINFISPFNDLGFCTHVTANSGGWCRLTNPAPTTSSITINIKNSTASDADTTIICVTVS